MKKYIARLSVCLLLFIIVLSINSSVLAAPEMKSADPKPTPTPIAASDNGLPVKDAAPSKEAAIPRGAKPTTPEHIARWSKMEKTPTPKYLARMQAKAAPSDYSVASQNALKAAASSTWHALSPFTYYYQQTNYTCGPASVRMALKYINGSTPSESSVASGCNTTSSGTSLDDMIDYINDMQSANPYAGVGSSVTQTTMKNNLYEGITDWDAPPIVGVWERKTSDWPYNADHHFIAVYSVRSNKSEFAVCDPWAGYVDDNDYRWYEVDTLRLHSAMQEAGLGYMW